MNRPREIRLFATHPHDCSYLSGRQATTVFIDPDLTVNFVIALGKDTAEPFVAVKPTVEMSSELASFVSNTGTLPVSDRLLE